MSEVGLRRLQLESFREEETSDLEGKEAISDREIDKV